MNRKRLTKLVLATALAACIPMTLPADFTMVKQKGTNTFIIVKPDENNQTKPKDINASIRVTKNKE